ncbi:MAG: succinate dehydrogenase, hydrophobic membrane anchor protein [Alphaproteobacteria bacterium]|jgi:succinate dehydrogenase / fumarate reductase membrane anchor subunit|uniref:Succinate dehydrogenase hydrophobic membrane anchor subunit n=1 Tax=Sphingomonas longa TaxID=2778730 RepID=A0ABS2D4P2_9SPHN|nr:MULTISPECIES: succinate dehydrogenase, hydrophobic membrane anchor protein [Alphaproteobacteria]MBM6575833.1 succinate dehydrogenase, hydrophobic membrane anchor protein [Sphingomonas sp. BT552]MBR7708880.1 succinate dehydrogenase, hydrophobic membrane anchor protein [Microvirga sp. SRT01]RYY05398.1 MAG: succinate dehydrogenase, hydrophobic membrane anchor protein [Alphaproteobacteria bacterium]
MRSSLGRVRGLGSAKEGAHHWWQHRLTAGSNFLLMTWLLISILRQPAYDYTTMRLWMESAWVAIPMILLVLSVFWHFRMGLQTVIEDYQHDESRVVFMILLNFFVVGLGAIAIVSILKITFGAAA